MSAVRESESPDCLPKSDDLKRLSDSLTCNWFPLSAVLATMRRHLGRSDKFAFTQKRTFGLFAARLGLIAA